MQWIFSNIIWNNNGIFHLIKYFTRNIICSDTNLYISLTASHFLTLKIFHFALLILQLWNYLNVKNGSVCEKPSGNIEKAWNILLEHTESNREEYAWFHWKQQYFIRGWLIRWENKSKTPKSGTIQKKSVSWKILYFRHTS